MDPDYTASQPLPYRLRLVLPNGPFPSYCSSILLYAVAYPVASNHRNYELQKNHNRLFNFLLFGSIIRNQSSSEVKFSTNDAVFMLPHLSPPPSHTPLTFASDIRTACKLWSSWECNYPATCTAVSFPSPSQFMFTTNRRAQLTLVHFACHRSRLRFVIIPSSGNEIQYQTVAVCTSVHTAATSL